MTLQELARQHCVPRKGAEHALDEAAVTQLLAQLPGWQREADGKAIAKSYRFADFHRTMGFLNAAAFIANQQDHHPDIVAGYGHCRLAFSTHDVGALSLNDFICAAKIERLIAER